MLIEINIDALVGPTHHFGGLGVGNVASQTHAAQASNPRQAALEGLAKAYQVAQLGVPQFLWLPPQRGGREFLSDLGFHGTLREQLRHARDESPRSLSAAFSSAFMWAANSCTFTPATDASDQRNHFTPANLLSSWHRGTEQRERSLDIANLFNRLPGTVVHNALPSLSPLRDEGAANHMRLSGSRATQPRSYAKGLNIFVHGEQEAGPEAKQPQRPSRFYPRHTLAASQAIARRHCLDQRDTFFLHQHPDAIAAGVFHNDVIATSHNNVLLHHERAFLNPVAVLEQIDATFEERFGERLNRIIVSEAELPLDDAIRSYFFNSQIVSPVESSQVAITSERMALVCPEQCKQIPAANNLIERLVASSQNPISEVHFFSLNESMANGGGPACLRLRVQIPEEQLELVDHSLRLDDRLFARLSQVIEATYPTEMNIDLLANPDQIAECSEATSALMHAIKMP